MYAYTALCLTIGVVTKIYWTNYIISEGIKSIISSDISGKNHHVLLDKLEHAPFGIGIMLGRVFWSDWGSSRITSANKITGDDVKTELNSTRHTIGDIHVFSFNNTVDPTNYPCRRGTHSCSHLCLPNSSHRGYRCACSTGITLTGDRCNDGKCVVV